MVIRRTYPPKWGRRRNGSTEWTPPEIDGCKLWLRSDLGVTKGADPFPVSIWADQSGDGNDATQSGADAIKPIWVDNQINGIYPVIRFDGVQQFFICNGLAATFNG